MLEGVHLATLISKALLKLEEDEVLLPAVVQQLRLHGCPGHTHGYIGNPISVVTSTGKKDTENQSKRCPHLVLPVTLHRLADFAQAVMAFMFAFSYLGPVCPPR